MMRSLSVVLLAFCAGCTLVRSGEWNYGAVRVPYDLPLTAPVSLGAVIEMNGDSYLPIGDYVPLERSEQDTAWDEISTPQQTSSMLTLELSDRALKKILGTIGLSKDDIRAAGVTKITVRATGRNLQFVGNRLLLESLLNETEYPLPELESLLSRVDEGHHLKMCVLEECADQVFIGLYTKKADEFANGLRSIVEDKASRGELRVTSIEVASTNDLISLGLRGKLVLRRVWGDLLLSKSGRLVVVWRQIGSHPMPN